MLPVEIRLFFKSDSAFTRAQIGNSRSGAAEAVHDDLSADRVSGAALGGRSGRGSGGRQITGRFGRHLAWTDCWLHCGQLTGCDGRIGCGNVSGCD